MIRSKKDCLLLLFLFNIIRQVPANVMRQEKEIKGIQVGKGEIKQIKLSLFTDDMTAYVENPQKSTKYISFSIPG